MGTTVLREIVFAIRHAQYFALMADEVAGSSNKEQVVIWFRSVDEGFQYVEVYPPRCDGQFTKLKD